MEEPKINVEVTEEKKEFTHRPKWAFDSEYKTENLREVRFLADKGIVHTFVRKTPDYNVSQYKYKKTPALFAALVEFYTRVEIEREYRAKRQKLADGGVVKPEAIKIPTDDVISPEIIKNMQETLAKYAVQISEATKNTEPKDETE